MNKKLNINLIVRPDCKLIAVDNSDYNEYDLTNHVMVEFLSFKDAVSPIDKTIKARQERHNRGQLLSRFSTEFILEVDGTYSYYKLVIPTLNHFQYDYDASKYINLGDEELFFLNGKLYKSNIADDNEYTLEEVLANSEVIDNYINAYNVVQSNGASQTLYCPIKNVFSVCKLQRCLVSLQKQLLLSNSKTCSYEKCIIDEDLRNRRDFLLSALYVLDYLKDLGNFTEAQRILDNLSTCNPICGDELEELNNNCGCGSII